MYPITLRALLWLLTPALLVVPALLAVSVTEASAAGRRTLCVHGIEPPGTLKVHSGPGEDSAVLGGFPAKACDVKLAGRCQGHWCQMSLGNSFGWVDTRHIGVYELPDGARAASVRPVPNAPFDPAKEKPADAAAAPAPRIVIEKAPPPKAGADKGPPARITVGKQAVPRHARVPARPQILTVRPVVRPQPVARPSPRMAPRPVERPYWVEREPSRTWGWAPSTIISLFASPSRPIDVERSSCVIDVARWDTLRIRSGPGVQHREVGEIPPRACGVVDAGGCYGSWCRIAWRGQHGWVNTRYLE